MHFLTLISKFTNYANKFFEYDCPQMDIYVTADNKQEAMKKMSSELNKYFEVTDLKVIKTQKFNDRIVYNIELKLAR